MQRLKSIIRILYQNKLFSIINLVGLSLGIASALLIFFWVDFHLSFDSDNENSDDIYRIIYNQEYPNQILKSAVSPTPTGPALINDYPEIINFSRYSIFFGEVLISYKEKRFYESNGAYADQGFLDMFSVEFRSGNKKTSLSDPYSIILTESFAEKYFGNKDPIGQVMLLENFSQLKVTGIIEDVQKNSHLQFDFLVPFTLMEKWGSNLKDWNNWAHSYTYIQTKENTSPGILEQKNKSIFR
jgi:putative ABC transport system permease protein